jgi:hypothetical protein
LNVSHHPRDLSRDWAGITLLLSPTHPGGAFFVPSRRFGPRSISSYPRRAGFVVRAAPDRSPRCVVRRSKVFLSSHTAVATDAVLRFQGMRFHRSARRPLSTPTVGSASLILQNRPGKSCPRRRQSARRVDCTCAISSILVSAANPSRQDQGRRSDGL